jgi:hypothetical protein
MDFVEQGTITLILDYNEDLLSSNHSLYGDDIHQDYFIEMVGHSSFDIAMSLFWITTIVRKFQGQR